MQENQARAVAKQLEAFARAEVGRYEVDKVETEQGMLRQFHQWANGKPLVAGYRVTKLGKESYYLLLIDWPSADRYYLVIYNHDITAPVAELHRTVVHARGVDLLWTYTPRKRDGLNPERKAHFKQLVGTVDVQIPLPQTPVDVEEFFDRLFELCRHRQLADRLPLIQKG